MKKTIIEKNLKKFYLLQDYLKNKVKIIKGLYNFFYNIYFPIFKPNFFVYSQFIYTKSRSYLKNLKLYY